MEVRCPSGLVGEVRKLKTTEANILADRKAAKRGETIDRILSACWLRTTDVGPYAKAGVKEGDDPVPWSKILVCDRFVALVAVRIATYGPDYVFPVLCPDEGGRLGCGRFQWGINLAEELPLYDLPEESRAKIAAGENRFEAVVNDRRYVFKLLTGYDEKRNAQKLQDSGSELMSLAVASRIVSIDGIGEVGVTSFVENLDLPETLALLEAFEKVDGGFETKIDVVCPKCGNQFEQNVPFEGAEYWLPRTPSRRRSEAKKKTSAARPMRNLLGGRIESDDDAGET